MFVAVWEFTVQPGHRAAFEHAYGPDGDWAQLFRRANGYISTSLLRDTERPDVYLTVDCWDSQAQLEAVTKTAEYQELDRRCTELTAGERRIGGYLSEYDFLVPREAPGR